MKNEKTVKNLNSANSGRTEDTKKSIMDTIIVEKHDINERMKTLDEKKHFLNEKENELNSIKNLLNLNTSDLNKAREEFKKRQTDSLQYAINSYLQNEKSLVNKVNKATKEFENAREEFENLTNEITEEFNGVLDYNENEFYTLDSIRNILTFTNKFFIVNKRPLNKDGLTIELQCISTVDGENGKNYYLYKNKENKYRLPTPNDFNKELEYMLISNKEIRNEVETKKDGVKYYDMTEVKAIRKTENSIQEKIIKAIEEKKDGFEHVKNYRLQIAHILLDTSYIWIDNEDNNKFNEKNYASLLLVARLIKGLALNRKMFLGIKATKNKNGFLIVKVANSLEDWKKALTTPKPKKETKKDEVNESENTNESKNTYGDSLVVNEPIEDDNKVVENYKTLLEIALKNISDMVNNKGMKSTDRLKTIDNYIKQFSKDYKLN